MTLGVHNLLSITFSSFASQLTNVECDQDVPYQGYETQALDGLEWLPFSRKPMYMGSVKPKIQDYFYRLPRREPHGKYMPL